MIYGLLHGGFREGLLRRRLLPESLEGGFVELHAEFQVGSFPLVAVTGQIGIELVEGVPGGDPEILDHPVLYLKMVCL
jgi:hypothetical protein